MTAAQRATLEKLMIDVDNWTDEESARQVDALRAALGTCGTCAHLTDGLCLIADHGHPSAQQGRPMAITRPDTFGCTGWTAKEGA